MKIGHLFWQPTPDMNFSHHERLQQTEALVQICEETGFHGVSFGENHFSNYGYSPNGLMLAVGLGRRTERLNIATGVAVLPYWNPLRFAEDAATADLLLDGRLELGVGRGYQQLEYEGLGIPYAERQERFAEALDIVLAAWTSTELKVDGEFTTNDRAVNVLPKPYTKPHPRLYLAAFHEDSLRFAASYDFKVFGVSQPVAGAAKRDHEIYLDERRKLGKEGDHFTTAMNRQVYVVDSSRPDRIEEARQSVIHRGLWQFRMGEGLRNGNIGYEAGRVRPRVQEVEPAPEVFANAAVFGSPDMVIEQLRELRDEIGVQELNVMTDHGGLSFEEARTSVTLLGREVIPVLQEDQARRKEPVTA
jgi:alkanesulfonate monooxygenase SsuD/methylene tetrahydromethanopterin reductase-like flavin-dependent oxidoreductase (luciferase family)